MMTWQCESFGLWQEIYKDRKKFAKAVFEVSSTDLINMGISIVSYTIKDISDNEVCIDFFISLPVLEQCLSLCHI